MDEEQQKHIDDLAAWRKEAKAAQDKVEWHNYFTRLLLLFDLFCFLLTGSIPLNIVVSKCD